MNKCIAVAALLAAAVAVGITSSAAHAQQQEPQPPPVTEGVPPAKEGDAQNQRKRLRSTLPP